MLGPPVCGSAENGYGPAGLCSGEAARLARIMLVGHTAFGVGIGLGTALLVARRR